MPTAEQKRSGCDIMLNIIIHVACLSDHDYFIPLNTNTSDPYKNYHSFKQLAKGAWPLNSLHKYDDSCYLFPWSLNDTASGINVRYQRECHSYFTRNLGCVRQHSPCSISHLWICEIFLKEGPELEWLFFHQFVYIMWEGSEIGSVTRATECTQ